MVYMTEQLNEMVNTHFQLNMSLTFFTKPNINQSITYPSLLMNHKLYISLTVGSNSSNTTINPYEIGIRPKKEEVKNKEWL